MNDEAFERERRARDLAVETALRTQEVNGRLKNAELRLDRINGSIDRFNDSLVAQDKRMASMERAFGEFKAVADAIAKNSVTTKTFILGVIAVVIPIVVLFLSRVH